MDADRLSTVIVVLPKHWMLTAAFWTLETLKWGSSGFAGQRNLRKICPGIRNSSNFSAERRDSPPLPDADFLENNKRNAEFS